jgi:hypothetical protein
MFASIFSGKKTEGKPAPMRSTLEGVCKKTYGWTLNSNTQFADKLEFLAMLCRNECCIIDWTNKGTNLCLMISQSDETFTHTYDVRIVDNHLAIGGKTPIVYDLKKNNINSSIFTIFADYGIGNGGFDSGVIFLSKEELVNLAQTNAAAAGGARKSSSAAKSAAKWVRTARKVSVKNGTGKPVTLKTVYRNSKTGDLRVRKITRQGGTHRVSYIKFK